MLRPSHWLSRTLIAGFVATALAGIALLLAYMVSTALAAVVPGTLGQWLSGLTSNEATAMVQSFMAGALLLHICVGLVFAVLYATYAEQLLSGPGWRRGATFALLPYVLSVALFLPAIGGGFLGFALGAGPLPLIGNLVLHLIYGSTLGAMYAVEPETTSALSEARLPGANLRANLLAEDGFALGLVVTGVSGAIVGCVLTLFGATSAPLVMAALVGATLGAVTGALVGSFVGLARASRSAA